MNNGRIDPIIVNRDHIYISEFKMDQPVKVAISQIKEKGYAYPYLSDGKPTRTAITKTPSPFLAKGAKKQNEPA
jgi:hypothetical protein